jgi:glycosyltransferase involved in cell wall biosynthesis
MNSAIILGRRNGVGLDQDAKLLACALEARGVTVSAPRIRSLTDALSPRYRADVAFHLERVAPRWWMGKARRHILIPNQERYPQRLVGRLARMDAILCKTRHAEAIFRKLHGRVSHLGFTSPDRLLEDAVPDYSRFIHVAGRSTLKNTALLLDLWRKHSEWPRLTLIQHPENAPSSVPDNVELIARRVTDDELRDMQNDRGIHLCPSLSEGWGHYIAEAMSCRAVTLTTDGPPMNELVAAGRGVVVPVSHTEPRHLGTNFHADPTALEAAIRELIAMPDERKKQLGAAAREWYLENHRAFTARVAALETALRT